MSALQSWHRGRARVGERLPIIKNETLTYLSKRLGGYGFASVVETAGAFVISVALGRLCGSEILGDYVFAQGLGLLVSLLLGLGVNHSLLVQVARGDGDRGVLLRRSIRLTMVLQLLSAVVILGLIWLFVGGGEDQRHTYLFGLLPCLTSCSAVLFAYGAGCDQLKPYISLRVGTGLLRISWLLVLAFNGGAALDFARVLVCVEALVIAVGWLAIWRHHPAGLRGPWRFQSDDIPWLKASAHLGISQFIGQVTLRVDAVMIRLLMTREAAGLYGAARTLAAAPRVLENALLLAMTPKQGQAASRGGMALWKLTRRILTYLVFVTALEILILGVLAPYLMIWIYGSGYTDSVLPMRLLLFALPLTGSAIILRSAAYCADRAPAVTRIAVIVGLANILGNGVLIPLWGLHGAVAASLASLALWAWGLARVVSEPLSTPAAPLAEESDAGNLS